MKNLLLLTIVLAAFHAGDEAQARLRTVTVRYGPDTRHKIKVRFDKDGAPRGLNIHFHGGGFTSGSPTFGPLARQLGKADIFVAGATYRFIKSGATKREILEDGARAVQFMRLNAEQYNIDPDRISVSGYSAGGVIAAWIALHDDLADLLSNDPVLNTSSRVSACWMYKSQVHPLALADWIKYTDWSPSELASGIVAYVAQKLSGQQFAQPFDEFDFPSQADYETALDEYNRDTSPFYQASSDDPPVAFLENATDDIVTYLRKILPDRWGNLLHSPALMIPLQQRLKELAVPNIWGKKGPVTTFIRNALAA